MSHSYLLPEDVSAADASAVLAFLNAAQSADEIDRAIDNPDQSDIGTEMASRLLARRNELGGFRTLDQVYAVAYIGPHRFTQLVTSLSGAKPPRGGTHPDQTLLAEISRRLSSLETQLSVQPGIRIQAVNPDALIGQETTLLAEISSADGRPLIDQEVTFVSTWGRLSGRHGIRPVSGNSITVRSDHLGLCRVRLGASVGETLSPVELSSLTRALTLLGTPSDSPRDSLEALTELARQYRAPGNEALRNAMDVLSRRYAESPLQDSPTDSLSSWPRINVTVIAMLPPESEAVSTQPPSSMVNLHQRNWFYAWMWAYRLLLENESQLGVSLDAVDTGGRSGRGVLADIYNRVGSFVGIQEGLIGKQLGEQFAAERLSGFLENGLKGVTAEERKRVLAGIASGVGSLQDSRSFSTLSSSRTEAQLDIDSGLSKVDTSVQLGDLESRIKLVESNAIGRDEIGSIRDGILSDANAAMVSRIGELQATMEVSLTGKADVSALTDLRAEFAKDLQTKADVTAVEKLQSDLARGLDAKADASSVVALNRDLSALDDRTRVINTDLGRLSANLESVNTRIDVITPPGPVIRR